MLDLSRLQAIKDEAATAGEVEGEDAGGGRIVFHEAADRQNKAGAA